MRADASLNAGSHVGHLVVMTARTKDDEINVRALETRGGECSHRSDVSELLEWQVRDATLADPGPAEDPFIAGGEDLCEILIAQHRGRQTFAPTRDSSVGQVLAPAKKA